MKNCQRFYCTRFCGQSSVPTSCISTPATSQSPLLSPPSPVQFNSADFCDSNATGFLAAHVWNPMLYNLRRCFIQEPAQNMLHPQSLQPLWYFWSMAFLSYRSKNTQDFIQPWDSLDRSPTSVWMLTVRTCRLSPFSSFKLKRPTEAQDPPRFIVL